MATFYLDTSAFAKRYLTETGSEWVRELVRPSNGMLFSQKLPLGGIV